MGDVIAQFVDWYDAIQIVNTFHPDIGYERRDGESEVDWRMWGAEEECIELGVRFLILNHDRMEEVGQGDAASPGCDEAYVEAGITRGCCC